MSKMSKFKYCREYLKFEQLKIILQYYKSIFDFTMSILTCLTGRVTFKLLGSLLYLYIFDFSAKNISDRQNIYIYIYNRCEIKLIEIYFNYF